MKMNKMITFGVCLAITGLIINSRCLAEDIYPTLPGSDIRDARQPGYHVEDNTVYPTLPGSDIRDSSKPGYIIQGDTVYQTIPGSDIRDYSKPGYRIRH